MTELEKALRVGKIRYSRDHDDSEPFPYEVVFTMPEWKRVEDALAASAAPQATGGLRELVVRWRESANLKHGLAPHASAQLFAAADELEAALAQSQVPAPPLRIDLADALEILAYASEGRTNSVKPDLLANEINRRIARRAAQADPAPAGRRTDE